MSPYLPKPPDPTKCQHPAPVETTRLGQRPITWYCSGCETEFHGPVDEIRAAEERGRHDALFRVIRLLEDESEAASGTDGLVLERAANLVRDLAGGTT